MGSKTQAPCSACGCKDVVLQDVSRELAWMRFLQLQQCGEFPVMCEMTPDSYTVCRGERPESPPPRPLPARAASHSRHPGR